MDTQDRTYDVVVFGATGFTGRLVCEHLHRRAEDEGVRWAIAGRDRDRLAAVAAAIGAPDLPVIHADATDPDSIRTMAGATKVVCTTVGPYAEYGEPVVAACADAGTDYVDLTGEPQFVRRMLDRHAERAAETGARIVHSCGFDSIPSDIGTLVAQTTMQERHGVPARRVRMRLRAARGGASGGTLASMAKILEEASSDEGVAAVLADPYSLLPAGERFGPHLEPSNRARYDEDFGSWTGPFIMEAINARIVRRSNAVLGAPWGRDFQYVEAVMTGDGPRGRARATALAAGVAAGETGLTLGPVRALATRLMPGAGTGPDAEARRAGFFDVRILAEHPEDRSADVRVRVVGDRDPGYGSTSRMLGEAALCLAAGESSVGGGSWTPASALGLALRDRLEAHAGVTFTVED